VDVLLLVLLTFSAAATGAVVHRLVTHDRVTSPQAREERRAGLCIALRRLRGAAVNEKAGWVSGRTGGFHVTYRLKSADFGRTTFTEIEVALPEGPAPLELELRPHKAEASTKLLTGNPFYDAFYLRVDPTIAGPELFDMSIRKRLLDLRPIRLSQGSRGLRVRVEGWSQSPPRVRELLALSAALGARLAAVSERLTRMGKRAPKRFRRWYR
jgi:hypothetical protein